MGCSRGSWLLIGGDGPRLPVPGRSLVKDSVGETRSRGVFVKLSLHMARFFVLNTAEKLDISLL